MRGASVTVQQDEATTYREISGPTKYFDSEGEARRFVQDAEFEDMRKGRKLYYYVEVL